MLDRIVYTNRWDEEITIVAGETVVGFKSDCEQYGRVIKIARRWCGSYTLIIENEDGFEGGYIGGETRTEIQIDDCWVC